MRIAICDDNRAFIDILGDIVEREFRRRSMVCEIFVFSSGISFMTSHRENPFDVVFLDILMPQQDGFQTARLIREVSQETYIVFVTTENNLVFESFDFKPFNFIPKGDVRVLSARMSHVIGKLVVDFSSNRRICLTLPFNEVRYVMPKDILYIRSRANYIDISLVTGEIITLRTKLDEICVILPQKFFARIHNRIIVNMQHIRKLDYPNSLVVLDNGVELESSRKYKQPLKEAYIIYMRESGV